MTSQITFSNIKYTVVKSSSDITKTERSDGKLQAGCITSRFVQGLQIDVFVLKSLPLLITDIEMTFDVHDLRWDTRRCFQKLADIFRVKGKLPVHSDFFKKIRDGDIIIIILHEVNK